MLTEQDNDQLSFEIDNPGAPNTIYITSDESVNKLVLKITTNVPGTQLTPGQLVSPGEAGDATGSILYLDLSPLQLTPEQFNKIECKADNWQTKSYPPLICLTPTTNITLGNGPGDEIDININKLTISKAPVTSGVSMSVSYYRVPPITLIDSLEMTSYFSVVVQAAPGGHEDLHDVIECHLSAEPYICNTIPGYDAVANKLLFILKAGTKAVTVDAGADTVFTVSMVYADAAPGYGALTTPQKAIHDISVTQGQNASEWKITKDADLQNPCWRMVPPAGKPLVGTGTKSTVEFIISNIITDFKPGPTLITVEYKGINGYDAGSYSLLIRKIAHVDITEISVSPNPSYLNDKGEVKVNVHWNVSDAGTLVLYPGAVPVTGKTSAEPVIKDTTEFSLFAYGSQLGTNGNVASKPVSAIVLPKINSFKADPVYTYYKSFANTVQLAWNVASPGKVSLFSSVTGRNPVSFNAVGMVDITINKPQMITLEPDGIKNPRYMRNVVLSAFKLALRTENFTDMTLTDMVCMPLGNIMFANCIAYQLLSVINTLTFKAIMPAIKLSDYARGLVLSPDGKLLYVPLKNGTISVFQVNQTALNNVTVTLLTTITNAAGAPKGIAVSPTGDQVYVLDGPATGNGVLVVYSKSADNQFSQIAKLWTQAAPYAIAVSPTGDYIFVTNRNSNSVSVFARGVGGAFSAVNNIFVGSNPEGIAVSPDGETVFVCNNSSKNISIISTKTLSVTDTLPIQGKPIRIAITRSSDYVFITTWESTVTLIGYNYSTDKYVVLEGGIRVSNGYGAHEVVVSPGGNQVFVSTGPNSYELNALSVNAYEKGYSIRELNMLPTSAIVRADGAKVLTWKSPRILPDAPTQGAISINAHNYEHTKILAGLTIYEMAYAPDNKLLYVIQEQNDAVTVTAKDAADYSQKGSVAGLDGVPMQIAVSSDSSLLFVSITKNGSNNAVAVVNTADLKIASSIKLQTASDVKFLPMAVTPDMSKIFVAQRDVVSIIEKGTNGYALSTRTIAVSSALNSLAALPDGSRIVGVSNESRMICVIDTEKYTVFHIEVPANYCNSLAGLAVSPDGRNIAVSAAGGATLLLIDMLNYNSIDPVATEQSPQHAVYLPDGSQIFVPCQNGISIVKQIQPG
jgi:YVTN family beta-propeller protein